MKDRLKYELGLEYCDASIWEDEPLKITRWVCNEPATSWYVANDDKAITQDEVFGRCEEHHLLSSIEECVVKNGLSQVSYEFAVIWNIMNS
jgi:hypothetical protein